MKKDHFINKENIKIVECLIRRFNDEKSLGPAMVQRSLKGIDLSKKISNLTVNTEDLPEIIEELKQLKNKRDDYIILNNALRKFKEGKKVVYNYLCKCF
ncbi:MAG: hypothetical protein ACOCRK_10435 [bacterium]